MEALSSAVTDLNGLALDELFERLCGGAVGGGAPLARLAHAMREEDLGGGVDSGFDVTSMACIPAERPGRAALRAREPMTLAGLRCVEALRGMFAPGVTVRLEARDGDRVEAGARVGEFRGPLIEVLALERSLLNLVSRLSGVATMASRFVRAIEGTRAAIYDTRKTTPGLRALEKYAARCGGARCHRIGLYDALLIKDNHIAGIATPDLPGFVSGAIARARELAAQRGEILSFAELEVDTLEQFGAVLDAGGCGLDFVLLDNMGLDQLHEAVAMRDRSGVRIELEASGGVRLETVRAIAETGVERISAGAITHRAVGVDLGLDIE